VETDVTEVLSEMRTNLDKFFDEKVYLSYSAINLLLFSPKAYSDKYIDKLKEDKTAKYLIEGKLIHCLLLTPTLLEEHYIRSDISLPPENTKKVIDFIFKNKVKDVDDIHEYEGLILSRLIDINLHQSLKEDSGRIAKILTPEAINYWNFLLKAKGKEVIDNEIYEYCENVVEVIRNDIEVLKVLGQTSNPFDDNENIEVFNELPVQADMERFPFGFKGILDNVVVDHIQKEIIINDFKTTSKPLVEFKETIEFYNYWIQALMYVVLVQKHFVQYEGYTIKFNFIVIDSFLQYYIFKVTEATLTKWLERFTSEIEPRLLYHFENRDFNLPWELATKKLVL